MFQPCVTGLFSSAAGAAAFTNARSGDRRRLRDDQDCPLNPDKEIHNGEGVLSVIEKHLRPVLSTDRIEVNVSASRDWAVPVCGGRRCTQKMFGQRTGGWLRDNQTLFLNPVSANNVPHWDVSMPRSIPWGCSVKTKKCG